jgi:hypothetical protein
VKVEDGGGGGRASHLRSPELFGDEMDDALLDLEGPRYADERGRPGEELVLSWRTGMKRFDVRGLSQGT